MNLSSFAGFCASPSFCLTRKNGTFLTTTHKPSSRGSLSRRSGTHRMVSIEATPLEPMIFRGRVFFIKRDDVLSFAAVTGSKLRKFYSLLQTDSLRISDGVVSYGGAQSNAMLALACLCSYHRKPFIYITRTVSHRLKSTPGNYGRAIKAGMTHIQLDNEAYRESFSDKPPHEIRSAVCELLKRRAFSFRFSTYLLIPQGGAWKGAEDGVKLLAQEIHAQIKHLRKRGTLRPKKPILFLPAGTGTTAFYLQKHLQDVARVVAIPVSGDERYLVKQMRWLHMYYDADQNMLRAPCLPDVIRPRFRSNFADVTPRKLSLWKELMRAADGRVNFDLVYAPKAWEEVMLAIAEGRLAKDGEDVLYYHTGGAEGNQSMLDRFKRKGLLDIS